MAIFDPVEQRMCVRIVYDGAGGAGKTTNLKALCTLFATQHTPELYSPGELDGRTLYFDWVQITAGVVCGFPVLCQVISVPGQAVLTPRRRHLLATADVVVLVCDSAPAGIERAREGLLLAEETSGGRSLPIVIQANKQDQLHALPGVELARRLGLEGAPVVEAIATEGIGVVDTFVHAVRAVSKAMQAQSEHEGLQVAVGRAPVAVDLLERLERCEVDPEWAAEMFLEEVHASMLIAGDRDSDRDPAAAEARRRAPPSLPTADVETGFIWPAHTGRMVLTKLAHHAEEQTISLDADGRGEVVLDGYRLRTAAELRFEDREAARQALVRAARERTQLERLLAPETVLVAQPARDGALWLWTIQPVVPMLAEAVASAPDRQPNVVRDYAVAIADVVRTCLRNDMTVSLDPESFGVSDGTIRYVGDIAATSSITSLGSAMLDAMSSATRLGWDAAGFIEIIDEELRSRLTSEEMARATVVR